MSTVQFISLSKAFSKTGYSVTMVPLKKGVVLGRATRLSASDIEQANKLYKCSTGNKTSKNLIILLIFLQRPQVLVPLAA